MRLRPRTHWQFYPTREPFANGSGRVARVHCVHCVVFVRYTQTTSGCVRSGRERSSSAWLCSVNARVDASGASGRERRTFCICLQLESGTEPDPVWIRPKQLASRTTHDGITLKICMSSIRSVLQKKTERCISSHSLCSTFIVNSVEADVLICGSLCGLSSPECINKPSLQ